MEILIITPGYLAVPSVNGGAVENLVDIITKENEKYKRANFSIISVNDGLNIDVKNIKNTKYYFINNKTKKYKIKRFFNALINKIPNLYLGNAYIKSVEKILKRIDCNFDAVIIENNPLYILNIKKYFKCPIYLHLHNDYLNNTTKKNKKVYFLYDGILTVSDYIASRVKTIRGKDKKVQTLYNGIDLNKFNISLSLNEKKEIRKKYNIPEDDFVFLYTGRLIPAKGVKEMILAFNEVSKKINNLSLLIVGSSSFKNGKKTKYVQELEKLIEINKNKIKFTGYVEYKNIPKIYKVCDAQIVPSIWGEPLATTVIEGMASKTALIVNNVGGIPEMVGKNGALICDNQNLVPSLVNNMLKLYSDVKIKDTIVKNSFEKSKFFEKSIFYNNYLDILNK